MNQKKNYAPTLRCGCADPVTFGQASPATSPDTAATSQTTTTDNRGVRKDNYGGDIAVYPVR